MLRLSRAQLREIDRIAIEEYGLPGIVLMENAARSATDVAMDMLAGAHSGFVTVLCGVGNNGGDGLAVARHLHNRGINVGVLGVWNRPLKGDALTNLRVIQRLGIHVRDIGDDPSLHPSGWDQEMIDNASLVVDALYGTGLRGPLPGGIVQVIDRIQSYNRPILAIDLPSGMDCDTGEPVDGVILRANRTVTFVAEKLGFANPRSRGFTGEIIVGDIGCPREIIERLARPA